MDFRLFYYVKEIVFCPVAKNRAAALRCLAFVVREHKKGRGRVDWLPGFFFPQLHESMSQGKVPSRLWLLSHSCCLDTKSLQSWLSFEKGVPTIRRETFVTFSGVLSTFFCDIGSLSSSFYKCISQWVIWSISETKKVFQDLLLWPTIAVDSTVCVML